jgi:hypothetical protein
MRLRREKVFKDIYRPGKLGALQELGDGTDGARDARLCWVNYRTYIDECKCKKYYH